MYGKIEQWDVSSVTNMSRLCSDLWAPEENSNVFNEDISLWNTSEVTDMSRMFENADAFNQPIGSWDTAAVTNMSFMFRGAHVFDQPIASWDTSSVTNMSHMFEPLGGPVASFLHPFFWGFKIPLYIYKVPNPKP